MTDRARAAVLALSGLAVGVVSSSGRARELDVAAFHQLNADRGHRADALFGGITELGSIWGSVGAAAAIAAGGRRRAALRALGAAGATWALGQGLKRAFMRPRPYDAFEGRSRLLIGKPQGTSWPSSHPAVLIAFITVAERELDLAAGPRAAALVLACAVGVSRVALGVHYPSDVVSGLLLGRAVGLAWPRPAGASPALRMAR